MSDGELVEILRPAPGGSSIEVVFLNGCGTWELCKILQAECGIPVVLGWESTIVPEQQCMSMVGADWVTV
jgi:hypothetical protein